MRFDAGRAGRDVEMERVDVDLVADPAKWLAIGGEGKAGELVDLATSVVIAVSRTSMMPRSTSVALTSRWIVPGNATSRGARIVSTIGSGCGLLLAAKTLVDTRRAESASTRIGTVDIART
jgi:hypothetical protein